MTTWILAGLATTVVAASFGTTFDERPEIFPVRGSVQVSLHDRVRAGDRDIYPVNAAVGQTLSVRIASEDNRAAFQIFPPGTYFSQDGNDRWTFYGQPLRGAEGPTQQWAGPMTSGGRYLIVVGGGVSGADYQLEVAID